MSTQDTAESRPGVPADTFPLRLRIARVHAGDISIETAAQSCGVKPATWSTWERGVHKPPHFEAIVKAIAHGLGVDEGWLLNGGPLTPDPTGGRPDGTHSDGVTPIVPEQTVVTLGDTARPIRRRKSPTRRNSIYCSGVSGSTLSGKVAA